MRYSSTQQNMGVKNRGFTVVEMIVYIAVLALMSMGAISSIFALEDLFAKYRAEQLVFRSSTTALERIVHDIRNSNSVSSASSDIDGSLTLSGNAGTIVYATSGDAIHVTVNGVDLGSLTEDGVEVSELRFYDYDDVTEFVRVQTTMSATVGDSTVTRTFNAGGTLRGSYQ